MTFKTDRILRVAALLAFGLLTPPAHAAPRERLLMDFGWRFQQGDPADAGAVFDYPEQEWIDKTRQKDRDLEAKLAPTRPDAAATNLGASVSFVQPGFNDGAWRALDLPHDWVVELPFGGGSVSHGRKDVDPAKGTNTGWYRRSFTLPASDKGRALWVEFDGVYRNSLVWLNGHCLGRHNSGYTGFAYSLNQYANFGGSNTLVVRADATRNEGWFYEGGGIYRHVWLVKTGPVHVAHWGTDVTTDVQGNSASVTLATTVRNDSSQAATARLVSTLLDPNCKAVAKVTSAPVSVPPGGEQTLTPQMTLPSPRLWSLDHPDLYTLVSQVRMGITVTDDYRTPFGVRTLNWDADKGFFLNGKRIELKGVCDHQDHAGVGVAVPDRLNVWRLEQLKAMGCNAIRTSHNAPTPEVLDACDRMGILVMDENRRFDTTPEVLGQLTSLIQRDRNHPSVVIWSIANEEMDMQANEGVGVDIFRTMQDLVHKLDPTRPVTAANNGAWDSWGKGFSKITQVMGFNYYHNGGNDPDKYHAAFPQTPCVGTEEASTLTTRGEYVVDDHKGVMSAYDKDAPNWGSTAEAWWAYYQVRPWIAGAFVWTGFDYRGEPTPYNDNYSTQFGQMDTCGFPKDNFYYYQSQWTAAPMVHILPHWNWAGKEGQPINVWVYANGDSAELFLNGKSLGKKPMPAYSHLEWDVPYAPGALVADSYKGGKLVATQKIETTGPPAAVKLTPDRRTLHADGQDVSIVTVAVVDAQGRVVPTADNDVSFTVTGAKIIGVGNGNPASRESDKAPERKVFHGLAQVIVQPPRQPGPVTLSATSPGLTPETVKINAAPAPPRPVVP